MTWKWEPSGCFLGQGGYVALKEKGLTADAKEVSKYVRVSSDKYYRLDFSKSLDPVWIVNNIPPIIFIHLRSPDDVGAFYGSFFFSSIRPSRFGVMHLGRNRTHDKV